MSTGHEKRAQHEALCTGKTACDENIPVPADHVFRAFAVDASCGRSLRKLVWAGFRGCGTAIAELSV